MSRIMIAEEQPVARHALRLLMQADGHEVVAEAGDGVEAVQLARKTNAALMILELSLPRLGGLAVIERLAGDPGAPRMLVLTAQSSEYFAIRCMEAGAVGFVSKREDLGELKQAVKAVLSGHSYFPGQAINATRRAAASHEAPLDILSSRELSVLQLLGRGMSNVAIAEQLALSDKTVSTYKIRLKQKLNARSLVGMIDIARSKGLIEGGGDTIGQPAEPATAPRSELELLQKMLDILPYAVAVRDLEARLITCNQHYLEQHECALEDIRGKTLLETSELSPVSASNAHGYLLDAIATRQPFMREGVVRIGGKDQSVRHWGHPYVDRDGRHLGAICGTIDLTDRDNLLLNLRNAKERAEEKNRNKRAYLESLSTAIAEPVHLILAMLNLALEQSPTRWQEAVQVAHGAASSLLPLLDDMQSLSRLDAGQYALAPVPTDIVAQVRAIAEPMRAQAEAKQLAFVVDVAGARFSRAWIDPSAWRQLLENLLGNALKFTDSGGVTLRLTVMGHGQGLLQVTLEVSDTGIGIAEPDRRAVFQPFTQLLDTQRFHRGGSGLGLALCKRLVDRMEGTIHLESEVNVGTQIRVELMLTQATD
ncbi:ATP-binding protein [Niveibacterium sp. SC-1]|uniref:ATP-binding protein n=1 Tax=Niveibacterium sp. SC-1 TaxID=3135646 RepID=UPI00311D5926